MSAQRRLIVEADGGSRGNPGPAGFGAVVRDAVTGDLLAERAESIGRETNNVAEYRGMLAGLIAAGEVGGTDLDIRLDSKLIVEQMSGRWKIKHPDMQKLAIQAHEILRGFDSATFTWMPRAQNTHADRLANEAMDAAAQGYSIVIDAHPAAGRDEVRELAPSMADDQPHGEPSMSATTLLLVRHGRTPLTDERRFSGRGPADLTTQGRAEAQAVADRLAIAPPRPQAVISSPLARARQTAAPIAAALDLPVLVDDDLTEADFGEWEGHTYTEIGKGWSAELTAWLGSAEVAPPGGESLAASARRVRRARDRIIAAHAGRAVIVVSHGLVIGELLTMALAVAPTAARRMRLDPASVSEVDWYADGPATLVRLNDTAHLGR